MNQTKWDGGYKNATFKIIVSKAETWITSPCNGNCPGNCTDNMGGVVTWRYVRKSVSPIGDDIAVEDPLLKIICKGTTYFSDELIKTCVSTHSLN